MQDRKALNEHGFTLKIPGGVRHYGGALMYEMESATAPNIRKFLGSSLSSERKEKYSSYIPVMHKDTHFVYSVYMCFGVWRIGSFETDANNRDDRNETYREIGLKLKEILNK